MADDSNSGSRGRPPGAGGGMGGPRGGSRPAGAGGGYGGGGAGGGGFRREGGGGRPAGAGGPRRTVTDFRSMRGGSDAPAAEAAAPRPAVEVPLREPKRDEQGRSYGTGRRKNAIARVWVKPGRGQIVINGRESTTYFARPVLRMLINQPLVAAKRETEFDVFCTVVGGGLSGQAGAVRHGISRALVNYEPALRAVLKSGGFLTRDARVVERKKYGRHKARRSVQFSKR